MIQFQKNPQIQLFDVIKIVQSRANGKCISNNFHPIIEQILATNISVSTLYICNFEVLKHFECRSTFEECNHSAFLSLVEISVMSYRSHISFGSRFLSLLSLFFTIVFIFVRDSYNFRFFSPPVLYGFVLWFASGAK